MEVELRARFRFLEKVIGELFLRRRTLYPTELWMQRTFPRFHGKSFILNYSGNRGKSQFILPKSVAQRNAHASGGADGLRIGGDEFRLARNLGKRIVGNGIADHRNGLTVIFRRDQLRGVHAEDGGKHAVVGARGTAALHMTRHNGARLNADHLLQLLGDAVGDAGKAGLLAERGALLLLHGGFLYAHRALSHGDDGEGLAVFGAAAHSVSHNVDVIRNFRQEDDVRAAGDAGIQRQPARLVAHELDDHAAAMARGGRMDAVDHLGRDVHSGMEAEGDVRSPNIVVDGLGQADDVHALLSQQIRGLMRAVSAEGHEAIQLHLLVIRLHRLHLVHAVFADDAHVAERRAAGAENGAAEGEDAGEIRLLHLLVIARDQTRVAILNTDDLRVKHGIAGARHAADTGVQAGAVAAAGEDTDASFHGQ